MILSKFLSKAGDLFQLPQNVSFAENVVKALLSDEYRNSLLNLTSGDWGIDESKRVKEDEPAASFRKLNVD